jgi:ferric-dicitrate binding protein FerR (iron transport regulator)
MAEQPDPRDRQITDWVRTHREDAELHVDVDAAWSRFSARNELGTTVTPLRRRTIPTIWRIAAVLVAVAGGAGLWRVASNAPSRPAPMREVFALNGQHTAVTLDDGTRVSLNGGSRLSYPASSGNGARDVYLDGEAYFEVTHDAARAFRVHVKRGVVRDIGTRFSVRAYASQPSVEVAVVEGAVALSADSLGSGVELKAGDLGVLPATGTPTVDHPASLDRYVGFAHGSLVLEGMTLHDVASQLERWYGVAVTVDDTLLATRPVVARFRGETITQALDAITLALGARYELRGEAYVIRARAK